MKQQRRVDTLTRLDAGSLDVATAAYLLGVSVRHVRRLLGRFRDQGMASVIHANTGRPPANRTDPTILERILCLSGPGGKYHNLNTCHVHDLLSGEIAIGRSTLDRILRQHGRRRSTLAPAKVYRRRLRRSAQGMMLQMDASPFAWLEDNGPKSALLGAVDDATGDILDLLFRPTEDQPGYITLLRNIAITYGLPMAIYHDRHTILRSPKTPTLEDELAGRVPMSQIQRIMSELGIESIPAHSPQAKGRIERLWRTLQDRLAKELRLAGITSLAEANAFLPLFIERYNARFAKPPCDPQSAWVPLPEETDLGYYFAVREQRTVSADHCVRWQGQTLQLLRKAGQPSLAGKRVNIHTTPEGEFYVYNGTHRLDYRHIEEATVASMAPTPPAVRRPKTPDPRAKAKQRAWLFAGP